MMKANPNVIKGTNRPDLYKSLVKIQEELVKCEKVLAQYLETKRLTYPRFYFISPADLLDILSNGNNPEAVCKYVFDQAALGHLDVGNYPSVHVIHHKPCLQALDQAVRLDGKVEVLEGQNGGRYDRQGRRIRRVFPKLRVFRTGKKTIASSLPTPPPPPLFPGLVEHNRQSSNDVSGREMAEQVDGRDAHFESQEFRQSGEVLRRQAADTVDIRLPGSDVSVRQSNMVDYRDQRSLRAAGSGP